MMADSGQTHQELVYAAAIVILADDLYPRKLEIVREYIQNASDALDAFNHVAEHIEDDFTPVMKLSIQGKSVLIFDNGIGMDGEEIQKLKRIAYSEKREGHEAGYKGIGRLAGMAVANKLLISSTSYGDPQLHKFEFRAKELKEELSENRRRGIQEQASEVINRHTTISSLDVDPADHYTIVELREIDDRYPELLDPVQLREYIGDIGPVAFAPDFTYGHRISNHLYKRVPDYSPKAIWLATTSGDRAQIYKPYTDSMGLAEPEFIEVHGRGGLLAYAWYTTKGKPMLGKVRSSGGKFTVEGTTPASKKRLAGLVYKLFGFSIGDRSLPLRTLWSKDYTRPLWFTGEIHIVDKDVKPTTDRSDFVDNEARRQLYAAAQDRIAKELNSLAQDISNNRQAHDAAAAYQERFRALSDRLNGGRLDRSELSARKRELHEALEGLKRSCKDQDIQVYVKEVSREGRDLLGRLETTRSQKEKANEISDLARDVSMTSQARKVYTIVMETLEGHFRNDMDTYYDLSAEIHKAIKKRY